MQLEKELNSRGIPVKCVIVTTQTEELTLQINRYQIANYRATGFSPWEACHLFSGAVINKGTETPIKAYFYNGKVPIISMNEIKDPCFNTPMSILIKDVASKMNKAVFNLKAPDEKIEALRTEIDSEMENKDVGPFWKILELGYTNNPNAVQPLKKYAQVGDEFSKSCALSAIGILSPHGQLEFLKQRLSEGGYNERYMAIKALGDIGTPEAMQVIQDMKNEQAYTNEGGLKSCVDLYAP